VFLGKQEKRTVPPAEGAPQPEPTQEDVVYATCQDRPEILVMKASLFSDLNKGVVDLRDKHILDVKKEQITSLRVQRQQGLGFSLMKSGQDWQVTAPKTGRAKTSKVDDLLFSLVDLQAQAYPAENQASVDWDKYGLKVSQATLTLGRQGGPEITLTVGAAVPDQPGQVYLRTSLGNDVYTVDESVLRDLPQTTDDLLEAAGTPSASAKAPPSGMPPGMPAGMPRDLPPPGSPGRP
jgi:hypothetical protein